MNSGGLIIRLIDVVLIILLGFLNISDFILKAQIKLDTGKAQTSEARIFIYFVTVLPNGDYTVEDTEARNTLLFSPVRSKSPVNSELSDLEKYLATEFAEVTAIGEKMLVVIKSDPETKIQYTIDVLDICEKYKISRSISY